MCPVRRLLDEEELGMKALCREFRPLEDLSAIQCCYILQGLLKVFPKLLEPISRRYNQAIG